MPSVAFGGHAFNISATMFERLISYRESWPYSDLTVVLTRFFPQLVSKSSGPDHIIISSSAVRVRPELFVQS